MMKKLTRGVLITVEGIDGSGKTTLINNLSLRLTDQNLPHITTQEPGATALGAIIRKLIQKKEVPMCTKAEYFLFAANRAQHCEAIVAPALQSNKIVISDRMGDSSIVYQGYGRGLDCGMIKMINTWTLSGLKPDITFYVKADLATALSRLHKRKKTLSSFEQEQEAFTKKLIAGFDTLFQNSNHVIILDGNNSKQNITKTALTTINQWIKNNTLLT